MYEVGSALWQSGECLFRILVPGHPLERILPTGLHLLQSRFMCRVATGNNFLQVLVLGFDHFVSGISPKGQFARSAHLLARHRLHLSNFPIECVNIYL